MGFSERLQLIQRNRRRRHPVANVSAGRAAELQLAAVLDARLGDSPFEYAAGLRIPHNKRRREIDFVITAPDEIWAVELKNWSGFVQFDGSNVVQHRAGGRGVVDHGRLVSDLRHKQRVLKTYLQRHLDEVPPIWTVLVFANDSVGISDELLAVDDMDVVRRREFLSAVPPASKAVPEVTESIREARRVLAKLGTWDLMMFHGGQIASGDVVGLSVDELCDRDRFRRLEVDVPRSWFNLFRSELAVEVTAVERDGGQKRFELGFEESVEFHRAGQPKPESFELRDVVGVSFGYVG